MTRGTARRDVWPSEAQIIGILRATRTPGATVAIASRAGIRFARGYGLADVAALRPMAVDAVMPVGSVGKLLTAVAVMRQVERGALDLDAPIGVYLGFDVQNPHSPGVAVTLRQLMTHTSGLGTDAHDASRTRPPAAADYVRAVLASGRGHEYGGRRSLWTAPAGRYQYSSLGVELAALAVARVTGQPFGAHVAESLCTPLGMASTYAGASGDEPAELRERRAAGHQRYGGTVLPTPTLHARLPESTGVLSTAEDITRLLVAVILQRGAAEGRRVLRPDTVAQMLTPAVSGAFPGEVPLSVGLSVQLRNVGRPDQYAGHIGSYPYGWWSEARAYPELDLAVAVLSNGWDMSRYVTPMDRAAPGLICDYVARLAEGAYDGEPREPRAWRRSYACGLLTADRLWSLAGVDGGVSELTRGMTAGARALDGGTPDDWDAAGFRAGVEDSARAGCAPGGLRAWLASPHCRVTPDELRAVALDLGASRAEWPAPVAHWADRVEESPAAWE